MKISRLNDIEIIQTIENLKQYIKDDIIYKKYKKASEKEKLEFRILICFVLNIVEI